MPLATAAAALLLASPVAAHDGAAPARDGTDPRAALLRTGEAALRRGETEQAIAAFDRAAMMQHAADTELDLVQAYLQAGEYRRALAFAAHVAGAHGDEPAAAAYYAWLLHMGGQGAYARRVLDEARGRHAGDAVLEAAAAQLDAPAPLASGVLLEPGHRFAPWTTTDRPGGAIDAAARGVASGILIDDGRRALVPLAAVDAARAIWLRNGPGETRRADIEARDAGLGMARLKFSNRFDVKGALPDPAPRDPFAGSPAIALGYVAAATPSWPQTTIGFLGRQAPGLRALGLEVPGDAPGGPVFDSAGRWIGIAQRRPDGVATLLPVSALHALRGDLPVATDDARPRPVPVDGIYERGLRSTVQVLVAD